MLTRLKSLKKFSFKYTPKMSGLMKRAKALSDDGNIEGLKDLQRTILRSLQAKFMLDPYLVPDHKSIGDIAFEFCNFHTIYQCYQGTADSYISLKEPVITFPWHPDRILYNLGTIGPNRIRGHFKNSTNHSVNYYWPLMLAKVTGGNHSIAQGILMGEGEVEVQDWYDLTPLMNKYRYNGTNWIDMEEERTISHCSHAELGMAWEIGRLITAKCPPPYQSKK